MAPTVTRLAGTSRYATAATIAETKFSAPVPAVFLTSGETFPDALAAGPAASLMNAPVLLTQGDSLPPETEAALMQLRPQKIFVIGGENAISPAVADQLTKYTPSVTRVAGKNRLATAIRVVRVGWTTASTVYLAAGSTFPDALSGGALAARDGAPILLSDTDHVRAGILQQIQSLHPSRVVLLGGTMVLSDAVAQQVATGVPSATVTRLAGHDRYATSAAIARAGWGAAKVGYLVQSDDFPDALAGVPASARDGGPLLLTRRRCMPLSIAGEASRMGLPTRILLGGSDVLADRTATTACKY